MGSFALPVLFSVLSFLFPQPEATIVFAGDAMQHQRQLDAARTPAGEYDYSQCFAGIAPWIQEADYAVVNLETTLNGRNYTGYPCFCTPDSYAEALRDAGFDMFLTANNHTLDRRDAGLNRTVAMLDSLGVDHIGTYRNRSERDAAIPCIREIGGIKVGFLNYTFSTNGIKVQREAVVDYIDKEVIRADVEATRRAGAELVIVIPHWGTEYRLLPDAWQKSMADYIMSLDVDIVMGGHPHVVQPMEVRVDEETGRRRLLVYSLGNFLSGMRTTDTRGGAVVKVTLSRDDNGAAQFEAAEYRLVYTVPGTSSSNNYRIIYVDDESDIAPLPSSVRSQCSAFVANATRIFDKHNREVPRHDASR